MTERAQRIATLYREGKGQREISRIIGISQPAVHKCLRKLGVITPEHPRGDNPHVALSPAPFPARGSDNRAWPREQVEICKNCGNVIPEARLGQKFCCNVCSAWCQGSRLVQFGTHSDWCPLIGQPWQTEGLKR